MKHIQSSLNNCQYKLFEKQRQELGESEYAFVKKSVLERMKNNEGVLKKVHKWLVDPKAI